MVISSHEPPSRLRQPEAQVLSMYYQCMTDGGEGSPMWLGVGLV